jgi:hypothetical protein
MRALYGRWFLRIAFWGLIILVITEVFLMICIVYWIYRLNGLPNDSINAFLGKNIGVLARVEEGELGPGVKWLVEIVADKMAASVGA